MGASPQVHSRGWSPPCLRRGWGHSIGSAWSRGDPVAPCKYLVGGEEEALSQLCTWPHSAQGLGQMMPFPPKLVGVHDSKITGWLCWSTETGQEQQLYSNRIFSRAYFLRPLRGGKVFYFGLRICRKAKPSHTCCRGRQEFTTSNNNKEGECFFRNLSMILMA